MHKIRKKNFLTIAAIQESQEKKKKKRLEFMIGQILARKDHTIPFLPSTPPK